MINPHPEFDSLLSQISRGPRLVSVPVAMSILDATEYDVLARIELGTLRWAWNLASGDATRRREVRIYRISVVAWLRTDYSSLLVPDNAGEAEVLRDCIPATPGLPERFVRAATLWDAWGISSTHGSDLITEGLLEEINQRNRRATQTRLLTRASVVRFLQARRIR